MRPASGIASQADALAKLEAEACPQAGCNGAAFFSLVFCCCRQKSNSPVGATTHSTINIKTGKDFSHAFEMTVRHAPASAQSKVMDWHGKPVNRKNSLANVGSNLFEHGRNLKYGCANKFAPTKK